jgi:microcystin-dependent protein
MSLADDVLSASPGTVTEFAGINLPAGYLWANGQAVSRTTYSRLFAALTVSLTGTIASGSSAVSSASQDLTQLPTSIVGSPISGSGIPAGTTVTAVTSTTLTLSQNATVSASGVALTIAPHGVGDGANTFNVPDRRGRAGIGHDKMGATSAAGRLGAVLNGALLGAAAGTETHTLSASQIPTISSSGTLSLSSGNLVQSSVGTGSYSTGTGGGSIWQAFSNGSSQSLVSPTASGSTSSTNTGGTAHPNMQPSIVMNYIIKT